MEEIFVDYTPDYWKVIRYNIKLRAQQKREKEKKELARKKKKEAREKARAKKELMKIWKKKQRTAKRK